MKVTTAGYESWFSGKDCLDKAKASLEDCLTEADTFRAGTTNVFGLDNVILFAGDHGNYTTAWYYKHNLEPWSYEPDSSDSGTH